MGVLYDTGQALGGVATNQNLNVVSAVDKAFVVISVNSFTGPNPNLPSGYSADYSGTGDGDACVFWRLYTGPTANVTLTWPADQQFVVAWASWSGVVAFSKANGWNTNDPPNLVALRRVSTTDLWVATANARASGLGGPTGYTQRQGTVSTGDAADIRDKVGSGSDTENPSAMLTGVTATHARTASTFALFGARGGGWGHTMAPRMMMVRDRPFMPDRPLREREGLWLPPGLVTA